MSALLINETFLNTFLRTQKSGFALKSVFLSGFTLLRAFLSAQKSAQGPTQPLCIFEAWELVRYAANSRFWLNIHLLLRCLFAKNDQRRTVTEALGQLSKQSAFVDSFLQMIWWRERGLGKVEKIVKICISGF